MGKIVMMLHTHDGTAISADSVRAILKHDKYAIVWTDCGPRLVYESYEDVVKMLRLLEEQKDDLAQN